MTAQLDRHDRAAGQKRSVDRMSASPVAGGAWTAAVSVRALSKSYTLHGKPLPVLDNLSFDVRPGEFVAFVGPSGSGKSTLLNIIAGLEEPDRGAVTVAGSTQRLGNVAYMPQTHSLLPWRSALENAILGLEVKGAPRDEARRRARELFAIAGLEGFERSRPAELSGGMRQRVAFLRTILQPAHVMLLDEPFGALDTLTRSELHEWLLGMWERLRLAGDSAVGRTFLPAHDERDSSGTDKNPSPAPVSPTSAPPDMATQVILVTHDVEEALLLSDRVYVLSRRPGRIRLVHDVEFPRPRFIGLTATEEFTHARARLLQAIREER